MNETMIDNRPPFTLLFLFLTFLGYLGPWVNHAAAGLVITGLDLAEYVKFLHGVRSGEIGVWREGFYLPLVAVSVTLSLYAYRREARYPWPVRGALVIIAIVAALNLLPPAWSPGILLNGEFRTQTLTLLACIALAVGSPFLALLPRRISIGVVIGLAGLAIGLPVAGFLRVLPAIADLYGYTLTPGWGFWTMVVGLVGMIFSTQRRKEAETQSPEWSTDSSGLADS